MASCITTYEDDILDKMLLDKYSVLKAWSVAIKNVTQQ